MSRLNLNIGSAHIVTFGEKAVDAFYVTDLTGLKIVNQTRQAAIRRALLEVFGVAAASPAKPPARRKPETAPSGSQASA
jgi:[protein-PII] uridylyltransferase